MRHIWLTIAYEGTGFVGFQRQTNGLAIQEVIEHVLERLTGARPTLYFAARTDTGVHAWAQECTFYTKSVIPAERFVQAMNSLLPESIVVRNSKEVEPSFSVRRGNFGKTYVYQILSERMKNPFLRRYVWQIPYKLDINAMWTASQVILGKHDFSAFRGSNISLSNSVRTIYDIRLQKKGNLLRIYITGDGFLYHMVRNIAGALVDVGKQKKTAANLVSILASRDRRKLGITAPAQGLCLLNVYFNKVTEAEIEKVLQNEALPWSEV